MDFDWRFAYDYPCEGLRHTVGGRLVVQIVTPEAVWHRRAINGLVQVIVQSTQAAAPIVLTATTVRPLVLK
jgi:hypothetical protein